MCNKCNGQKDPCGCGKSDPCGCNKPILCGCKTKVDLLCTYYSGVHLDPLNIPPGTDGNTVIKIINDYIKEILLNLELDPTVITSVGNGFEVYKGLSDEFRHEIKSVLEGEGIKITEQSDTLTVSIDPLWIENNVNINIEKVGTGVSIYKGLNQDTHEFKTIKSTDSVSVTESENEIEIEVEFPVIDGVSVGTGIPIYSGLEDKKINTSSLYSPNGSVLITKDTNPLSPTFNRVHIEIPNFDYIKSFYVNSNYTGSDADGSIIKPFPNFEAARTAFIGTGNILQPQFAGAKITLQTSSVTAENPTTNTLTIEFQNSSILTYTGTNVYDIDSEILFNLLANETYPGLSLGVNGELPFPIYMYLIGNGTIARTNGLGLVRWFGSKRNPLNLNYYFSRLIIGQTTSDSISFGEWGNNPSIYTEDIEYADGTKLEDAYGYPFKATTALLPTTPLFDIEFPNHSSAPTLLVYGSTIISSISQSHLKVDKNASIIIQDGGELYFNNLPNIISYSGVMGENFGNNKTYLPYSDKVMIDFIEGNLYGTIRCVEPAGFAINGWDSMFRMHPGASFGGNIQIDIKTNNFSNEIFKLVGNTNIMTSGGTESKIQTPNVRNFVNADGNAALVNVTMPNTTIFVRYAPMINTPNYSLNTLGSISSINSKPILTGYPTHPNLAAAQATEVKGTMYYNTGIDAFATVI